MGHGCMRGGNGREGQRGGRKQQRQDRGEDLDTISEAYGNSSAQDELSRYVQAYESARFYHKTFIEALDGKTGIRAIGLDHNKGGTGLSQASGFNCDPDVNKGTIHLSNTPKVNDYYSRGLQLRAFLPPERTRVHQPKGMSGPHVWDGIPPSEIALDPEHGLGAWVTREDIAPKHIQFPEQQEPTDEMLEIVGQHMPNTVDLSRLRELHAEARRQKRLSVGEVPPKSITDFERKFGRKSQ